MLPLSDCLNFSDLDINKKDVNNLYKHSERTGGEKPIDLVRATRPVLIVDEPQSVDGGLQGRGREALAAMHPLCTLRCSATHTDRHHMVYRLNAAGAYGSAPPTLVTAPLDRRTLYLQAEMRL